MKIIGKKLEIGMKIGVMAPSSPLSNQYYINESIQLLEEKGFLVYIDKTCYITEGIVVGTALDRAEALNELFRRKDIDVIFLLKGGYGSAQMLPFLDFNLIRANPKIIMGYSDITALLNTIYQKTNLITFHGPIFIGFGPRNYSEIRDNVESVLMNGDNTLFSEFDVLISGEVKGELIGGNLSVLTSLFGTEYEMNCKNRIICFEDIKEPPYKIDRMLNQFELAGKFNQASGFIFGDFNKCDDEVNSSFDIIKKYIEKYNKPTIYNVKFGHTKSNYILPIGALVTVDTIRKKVSLNEKILI